MKPEDKINIDPVEDLKHLEDLKPLEDLEPFAPVKSPLREAEVLPNAITRIDHYLKSIAGQQEAEELPNAITRIDHYLKAIADKESQLTSVMIFTCTSDNTPTLDNGKNMSDLITAYNSGYLVIVAYNNSDYIMLRIDNTGAPVLFSVNYTQSRRVIYYLIGSNTPSGTTFTVNSGLVTPLPTTGNKTIISNDNFNWILTDFPTGLPAVSSDDNGKILKVVDGAWAAVTP